MSKHPAEEISKEYRDQMQDMAKAIDGYFNGEKRGQDREVGFVLLVFPFGEADGGRVNYLSNGAPREDIVVLMKEMIARFEGQPEQSGTA